MFISNIYKTVKFMKTVAELQDNTTLAVFILAFLILNPRLERNCVIFDFWTFVNASIEKTSILCLSPESILRFLNNRIETIRNLCPPHPKVPRLQRGNVHRNISSNSPSPDLAVLSSVSSFHIKPCKTPSNSRWPALDSHS
jgi:hypothetical protein